MVPINIEITNSPDMAALAAIHSASFANAWDSDAMRDLFSIKGTIVFVAENKGFGILRHIGDEAEILTVAVNESYRRQGIAKAIAASMLGFAKGQGISTIFLEVRHGNVAAQALYQQCGFAPVSRRKGYYHNADGSSEDAIVMRWQG